MDDRIWADLCICNVKVSVANSLWLTVAAVTTSMALVVATAERPEQVVCVAMLLALTTTATVPNTLSSRYVAVTETIACGENTEYT